VLLPWSVRLAWLTLPFTAGSVLADALDQRSGPVQLTLAAIAWAAWGTVVLGLLVRRPIALTALRVVAPAAFGIAVWAAADQSHGALLAALAGVPFVLAFLPEVGAWLVNGAAYGDEHRYPLRAPGTVLIGPLWLSWAALVAGALVGPLLLAAHQWILGGVALVVGVVVALVCARALHALSMRWAVLVPAGLVLKDHVTLLDPVFFKRADVELLLPAPAGTDALDLTARAPGLAVELRLREAAPLVVTVPGERRGQAGRSAFLLFTPTRPGAFLADAASRRLPVGSR
jgi:hypothetical protein